MGWSLALHASFQVGSQPKETPYEYSKQNGDAPVLVEVTEEFFNEVQEKGSITLSQHTLRTRKVEI